MSDPHTDSPQSKDADEGIMVRRKRFVEGLVHKKTYLIGRCRGKRVLHVGCTASPGTKQALIDGNLVHSYILEA